MFCCDEISIVLRTDKKICTNEQTNGKMFLINTKKMKKFFTYSNMIDIDLTCFKLHYRITTGILTSFSLILSIKQFFIDDRIECLNDVDGIPLKILKNYCWTHLKKNGKLNYDVIEKPKKFYQYYQWVTLCLFLQVCFVPGGGGGGKKQTNFFSIVFPSRLCVSVCI